MANMFSLPLLIAVNDWQRGSSSPTQRKRRSETLAREAAKLAPKFRTCGLACFRQVALNEGPLWELLAEEDLSEAISSWTMDLRVATSFKGGVPPHEWRGVIYEIIPRPEQVVLNMAALYREPGFRAAADQMRAQIPGYYDGIGRYGDTQSEVVLKIESVGPDEIHTMGGYSSDSATLAALMLGYQPTEDEQEWFDGLLAKAGLRSEGPWWLTHEGWRNVYARARPRILELTARKGRDLRWQGS
jgi:hypothetical protein